MEIERMKCNLAASSSWADIRKLELDSIVEKSAGVTDPVLIKGMLRTIYEIDHWKDIKGGND